MSLSILPVLAAAAAPDGPPAWLQFLPIVGMGLVLWFLFLRPQMAQQKAQKAKLAAIKKGDQVLTGGGLIAKVLYQIDITKETPRVCLDDFWNNRELAAEKDVKEFAEKITYCVVAHK